MTRATEVLLAWANDRDGRRVHVATLDPARRRDRAPFRCVACGEELVARLGRQRARHFAHRPGSACALAHPETALHRDAKERLLFLCAESFAGRLAVRLRMRCPACRRETPADLASVGDGAVAEQAAGSLRPDVLVTRGGAPALALEVRVTHRIDAAKEAALTALSLPAVEIDAREAWEAEHEGGIAIRIARTMGASPCPACRALARAEQGRADGGEEAAIAELEAYRGRGLLGPRPGPPSPAAGALTPAERAGVERSFRCPDCGRCTLVAGPRLIRHACGHALRPVAWRGYDGSLVRLAWWRQPA